MALVEYNKSPKVEFLVNENGSDISTKRDFQKIDPISSLFGLALIDAMEESQKPKMALKGARFYPKSRQEAANVWAPFLNTDYLPNCVGHAINSLDRRWHGDNKEDLLFFNFAIPFMDRTLKQSENIKKLWGFVFKGIGKLEPRYKSEMYDEWIFKEKVELAKKEFNLELQSTLGKTFTAWKTAIDGYVKAAYVEKIDNKLSSESSEKTEDKKSKKSKKNKKPSTPVGQFSEPIIQNPKSLTDKIKEIWTTENLEKVLTDLQAIHDSRNKTNEHNAKISAFNEFLDKKSEEYVRAVDEIIREALTPK